MHKIPLVKNNEEVNKLRDYVPEVDIGRLSSNVVWTCR
jgi:hypothetical protein